MANIVTSIVRIDDVQEFKSGEKIPVYFPLEATDGEIAVDSSRGNPQYQVVDNACQPIPGYEDPVDCTGWDVTLGILIRAMGLVSFSGYSNGDYYAVAKVHVKDATGQIVPDYIVVVLCRIG